MPVLQFKGKTAVENYHYSVPHHRLEFDKKLSLLEKGQTPSLDGNLIIEGDNLLALKALLPTHAGKVKCVYIDPPYNTGNEGWVYNDNLTQPQFKEWIGKTVGKEGEDATRHDKWCCMMYPRLTLLRELLSEDGVIFISIDENELANLRLISDEIFHADMPLSTFVWKRRSSTGLRGDAVSVDHEYVLAYAKSPDKVKLHGIVRTASDYPYEDDRGYYASTDLTVGMTSEDRPNQAYTLINPNTKAEYPYNPDRVWGYEKSTMEGLIEDGLIIWPEDRPDSRMTRPRFKTYFDPENPNVRAVSSWIASTTDVETDDEEVSTLRSGLNTEGGRALKRALGKKLFDYPKPPSLIASLIRIATGPNDLVLDSFAGSGTTAEAVMEVNEESDGNRRFLLVQMTHDDKEQKKRKFNICKEVTAARAKAIGSSFTYARVGEPLFNEYKDFGGELPPFEDIAKYVFYTETSHEFPGTTKKQNPAWDKRKGRIGEHASRSYYLLYEPNDRTDRGLDREFLDKVAAKDTNRELVVYCERLAVHQDEIRSFEREQGKRLRYMLVPFNLK